MQLSNGKIVSIYLYVFNFIHLCTHVVCIQGFKEEKFSTLVRVSRNLEISDERLSKFVSKQVIEVYIVCCRPSTQHKMLFADKSRFCSVFRCVSVD